MGYRDYKLALSINQSLTGDADSTYFIDTELAVPGWDKGWPLGIVVNVETLSVAGTGIEFIIVHKTSEPTTADAELCSVTALAADLAAGCEIVIPFPRGIKVLRYVRLYYNLTAGTERAVVSAYVTPLDATGW